MDCGPSCLRMVAKFYGKTYSLQDIRNRCHISREGVSMSDLCDAAESIGLKATGVKVSWNQLKAEVPIPCIVHWNQNHFVVLYKISNDQQFVRVADPSGGLLKYRKEDFLKGWVPSEDSKYGLSLILEPTPEFYLKDGEQAPHYGFNHILKYLNPHRLQIIKIILAMLISSVISLILPFFTQAVVDKGIESKNISFVSLLLLGQLALVTGQAINNMLRNRLMLYTATKVSISLISDFISKLMKLPIAFFASRQVGDIMQRVGDHNRIQSFLSGSLLSMIIALVTLLVYSVILAGYNSLIFLVFFIGSGFYIAWVLLFLKHRRRLDYMRFQQSAIHKNSFVQIVEGMQDIKLNNCERVKRWDWERIQTRLLRINLQSQAVGQSQELGSTVFDQIKNLVITFIAARSVIEGTMTLGMMMALQYIMGQLNVPIYQFISFVQSSQDASISIDRLGEIFEMENEEPSNQEISEHIPENADIEFRNVIFQYEGQGSLRVLDGVSARIPHGKTTAIVGVSGSGKTTMLKMMLGFYKPTSGEVLLGGKPLFEYSRKSWRAVCGSVMQDGYIFSDTITGNIAVADEVPDKERVKEAADFSNLREWIEELPMEFNTRIGMDGNGLSAGQKQRILIARAAYKNASYLFLDEATNALDAKNEKIIMERLEKLFNNKTIVIVAHRLSTVRNADNILVLENGHIIEQGTHEDLVKLGAVYYHLVKNQLELEG